MICHLHGLVFGYIAQQTKILGTRSQLSSVVPKTSSAQSNLRGNLPLGDALAFGYESVDLVWPLGRFLIALIGDLWDTRAYSAPCDEADTIEACPSHQALQVIPFLHDLCGEVLFHSGLVILALVAISQKSSFQFLKSPFCHGSVVWWDWWELSPV